MGSYWQYITVALAGYSPTFIVLIMPFFSQRVSSNPIRVLLSAAITQRRRSERGRHEGDHHQLRDFASAVVVGQTA